MSVCVLRSQQPESQCAERSSQSSAHFNLFIFFSLIFFSSVLTSDRLKANEPRGLVMPFYEIFLKAESGKAESELCHSEEDHTVRHLFAVTSQHPLGLYFVQSAVQEIWSPTETGRSKEVNCGHGVSPSAIPLS